MEVQQYFDTDFIKLNSKDKRYCLYCGKEIMPEKVELNNDTIWFWKCTCEDALKAYQLDLQIKRLEFQKPRPKFKVEEYLVEWA